MKKYGSLTLCKALYSLDVYAFDLFLSLEEMKDEEKKEVWMDVRFCRNLKMLAARKMIFDKILVFQKMDWLLDETGKTHLYSLYRNKIGMPFLLPASREDLAEIAFSYPISYPEYFEKTNILEPFYSLKKSSKILTSYIERSPKFVRYTKIPYFTPENTKEDE